MVVKYDTVAGEIQASRQFADYSRDPGGDNAFFFPELDESHLLEIVAQLVSNARRSPPTFSRRVPAVSIASLQNERL
jgi:hypothetical protein